MDIRIAIISDLHCVYSPENTYENNDSILFSNMLQNGDSAHPITALLKLIEKEELQCDYLLCPGDITNKMDIQGLISGFNYLQEIKRKLQAKQLICTPGNHDVDFCRRLTKILPQASSSLKYVSDEYPLDNKTLSDDLINKGYCLYQDEKLIVLCVNSVVNFTDKDSASIIDVNATIINEIEQKLKNLSQESPQIRIVMTHHHPISITDQNYRAYDKSDWLENGDRLMDMLEKYGFSLFIHGHKHKAKLYQYDKFTLFCAGGFSAQSNLCLGDDANMFHVISLDYDNHIKGTIETWTFSPRKYQWEKTSVGFPKKQGFGAVAPPGDIANNIIQAQLFKDAGKRRYSDVEQMYPEISYLTKDQYKEFEEKLATEKICISTLGDIRYFILND